MCCAICSLYNYYFAEVTSDHVLLWFSIVKPIGITDHTVNHLAGRICGRGGLGQTGLWS
jgi:hypothetical protein